MLNGGHEDEPVKGWVHKGSAVLKAISVNRGNLLSENVEMDFSSLSVPLYPCHLCDWYLLIVIDSLL